MATIPKQLLLRAVRAGLKSGEIERDEIAALLPRRRRAAPRRSVPKSVRDEVKRATREHGLLADSLRFAVHAAAGGGYKLYLLKAECSRVAAPGISAWFADEDDVGRAAEAVVENYLQSIVTRAD